jgi:signal peptide peptidase SppA
MGFGGFVVADGTRRYTKVAEAIHSRPWAIQPAMLAVIEEVVQLRIAGTPLVDEEIAARVSAAQNGPRQGAAQSQGVAVIPVYGVLSQRMNLLTDMSGGTSVEGLTRAFRSAMADPDVGAIVLDVDSPGGGVEGITELAAELRAARSQKPIVAVANAIMASGAYWLASQADELIATPSAQVGSIGVIGHHVETSKADEIAGETYTVITAGKGKANQSGHVPLDDEGRAELQSMANAFYSLFVGDVAAGRGVTKAKVTDEWQASVLTAKAAKASGMVDRIDTLDATVARYGAKLARRAGTNVAASYVAGFAAAAIGRHKTATSAGSWDGPANEKRLPNERGPLRSSHAWVEDDGDPDAKASYKFIHHEVGADGDVGAANLTACSSGIAVLNGGRGGADIPASDRGGVHAHLAGHLTDGGKEAPPLRSAAASDTIAASLATMPIHEQLALLNAEGARVTAHYAEKARLRAKVGREIPATTEEQLAALASLRTIQSDPVEPDLDTDESEEADPPQAADWRGRARFDVIEAALRGGYELPPIEVPTP